MTANARRPSRWVLAPLLAIAVSLFANILPQRAGPIAAFVAVAPIAYSLLLVALMPLALLRRDPWLAVAVAAAGVMAVLSYAPPAAPPRVAASDPLTIMTWNLHGEAASAVGLETALARWEPDLVVLQEAVPESAALFDGDFTTMHDQDAATPPGILLATRLTILASGVLEAPEGTWDRPRAFWLTLDTGGRPMTFVGVHLSVPFPVSSLPCPYCPTLRDEQVAALAAFASERQAAGESVVVAGDLNLTEREVVYHDLAALTDVARGGTWRPLPISWLPPVLRLDYVLTGAGVGLAAAHVDCAVSSSDHCAVVVHLALP